MSQIRKFINLPFSDKRLFFEAVITSFIVKVMVTLLPIRWYSGFLGNPHQLSPEMDVPGINPALFKTARAIVRCRKAVPWHNRCLVEAITAKKMLNRRGLQSTLYFGVAKENQKMIAHAWLRCGSMIVTGKQGMQKFVVVNTFA